MDWRFQDGGGAVGKGHDGFFNDGRQQGEKREVKDGEILSYRIHVGVVVPSLDDLRLGSGVNHQGLDRVHIEIRFRRVGEGGVAPSDVESIVQILLVAGAATFEGSGSVTKIPGNIVQVAGDGARPAVCTGNRRNKGTKRNRFHFTKY
jgi:hypothetical protein